MLMLYYLSGEQILKGDRVLFHGEPGEIELVATDVSDPEQKSYVEEYGGGVMILEPKHFGRAFIHADLLPGTADLVFVCRAIA